MSKKLLMVLMAIASAVCIAVVATTAVAGPLPDTTTLSVTLGNGVNAECTTGSCFSMEVSPGFLTWTNIGPGTDLGFILGKNQAPGGSAKSGKDNTSGDLTAAWSFFSNFGSNCTGTFTAAGGTSVKTGADQNIFDNRSCSNATNCLGLTQLGSWHVAWNGIAIPMGSAAIDPNDSTKVVVGSAACKAATTSVKNCTGVTEWTLNPDPVVDGSTYVVKHGWVVPVGDPSGFGNVTYKVILRGTVTLPPLCKDMSTRCDDGNPTTSDSCNPTTGACTHTSITCDDQNDCTYDVIDPTLGCIHFNKIDGSTCNDNNVCTLNDVCSSGKCSGTPITCAAPDACTDPSCDPINGCGTISQCLNQPGTTCDPPTGVCLGGSTAVNSSNNNFTMLDPSGAIIGGTNDVKFTYNKIPFMKVEDAEAALQNGNPNATISSSCPFFGNTWSAHDVAVYGPGTYTVYAGCPPKSPSCGQGTPITFTVGDGELGGHMLFNWSSNKDIDVVDIWAPTAAFAPSKMFTQDQGCGTNDPNKVWDLMSKDSDENGVNGKGMVDGPFTNFNANFNLMLTTNIAPPTKPVLVSPEDKATGLPTTVEFRWKRSIDYDNDPITYSFNICTDPTFTGCTDVPVSAVAKRSSKGMFYAGGAGLFMIGITFIGGFRGKRRVAHLLLIVVLFSGGALISCNNSNNSKLQGNPLDIGEMSHTETGLSSKTTYYWRVSASDGKADPNMSKPSFSFTTQ